MIVSKKDLVYILRGAQVYATGGGGTLAASIAFIEKITNPVTLMQIDQLTPDDIVCTIFGVGGKLSSDPLIASQSALTVFQKILNKKISAIIPVELGALAVANALYFASALQIPLLDSDIVGMRCSPEIFLETITLMKIQRTPCVIADDSNTIAVLWNSESLEKLETFLRNFAISSGGSAYVAGYPLTKTDLTNSVPEGSITNALTMGYLLEQTSKKNMSFKAFCKKTDWQYIDCGTIQTEEKKDTNGFIEGFYTIETKTNQYRIVFKNENLVLLQNNNVLLTCPDSISLLDTTTYEAVTNFEANKSKKVAIIAKKAIPIWRTHKGKQLFSPENIGLPYVQKLL